MPVKFTGESGSNFETQDLPISLFYRWLSRSKKIAMMCDVYSFLFLVTGFVISAISTSPISTAPTRLNAPAARRVSSLTERNFFLKRTVELTGSSTSECHDLEPVDRPCVGVFCFFQWKVPLHKSSKTSTADVPRVFHHFLILRDHHPLKYLHLNIHLNMYSTNPAYRI